MTADEALKEIEVIAEALADEGMVVFPFALRQHVGTISTEIASLRTENARLKKEMKAHPGEVQLERCENCGEPSRPPGMPCLRCGHQFRVGP